MKFQMLEAVRFSAALTSHSVQAPFLRKTGSWRGPTGMGSLRSEFADPLSATENIRWKTPLPERGNFHTNRWGTRFRYPSDGKRPAAHANVFQPRDGKLVWQSGVPYTEKEPSHETTLSVPLHLSQMANG
jgi:hypothetical protein